jgi:hypothetical protein
MLSDLGSAAALFERMGARPNVARVLRDWGNALRATGEEAEARQKLEAARALFEEIGLEREANEVRAELAAS